MSPKVAYSGRGMVVTDHPYASLAGLRVLEEGGNAFDACVVAGAVLSVVLPYASGLGGDAFMLAKTGSKVYALSSSGRYASEVGDDELRELRVHGVPRHGGFSITVPGLVGAWGEVVERFCTMGLKKLLGTAYELAYNGFPASRRLAETVESYRSIFAWSEGWIRQYGQVAEGHVLKQREMAEILRRIMEKGADEFYRGETAKRLVSSLREYGCSLSVRDFQEHEVRYVNPLEASFMDYKLYELPPNSQGITTLQLLRLYELAGLKNLNPNSTEYAREFIRLSLIAYEDRDMHVADPDWYEAPTDTLLSDEYLIKRLEEARFGRRMERIESGDTTFLAACDEEGNKVGFIQSLYNPFGSGIVACGVPWNNRAYGFSKGEEGVNTVDRGKRPRHTLSILMAEKTGRLLVIGCAGGDLRPQLHALTLALTTAHDFSLENSINHPRTLITTSTIITENNNITLDETTYEVRKLRYPARGVGIVNAIEIRDNYLKGVADIRAEGMPLPLTG